MRLFVLVSNILLVAPLVSCRFIPSEAHSTENPLWTTDLRKRAAIRERYPQAPPFYQAMRQIAFGSNSELVVAEDSGPFAKPNEVQGFVMDARNGSVLRESHWTSGSWPFLFPTSTGKYVVVTDSGMALYTHGLEKILLTDSHVADKASPDGRYLSASETRPGHGLTIFLDADTLKPNGTEFRDTYVWSIADNRIASTALRNANGVIEIGDAHESVPDYETECKDIRPNFVTNDLVAVLGCGRMGVLSLTRGKVFSSALEGDLAFFACASRDGSRFVVLETFSRAGDPPSLSNERVVVFDVAQQRSVFSADIADLKGSTAGESSGVALSPDGSALAISSGGVVRLFALRSDSLR